MSTHPDASSVLQAAAGKQVLVVGELHLDVHIAGTIRGMSPEGPVPLVEVHERRLTPGGAGSVAAGIVALGASAQVVGVLGEDPEAAALLSTCEAYSVGTAGVVHVPGGRTNVRTRVTSGGGRYGHHTVLRLDSPPPAPVSGEIAAALVAHLERLAAGADAVVVVESNSGVTSAQVIAAAQRAARSKGILLVGDALGQAQSLRGYDVVLPNESEAAQVVGGEASEEGLDECGRWLVTEGGNAAAAITRGAWGISLFTAGGRQDVPTYPREVFDVTGAGDSVTAAFTVALLAGADLPTAAHLANLAAYVQVGRSGAMVVSREDVQHAAAEVSGMQHGGKLRSRSELAAIVAAMKAQGKVVVFTNGCFDLIHTGHVSYLQAARARGDALVVALNSDASVRSLKGPTRPILSEDERVMILSALESVTWVMVFEEQRVTDLLAALKPTVWVKGGDYDLDTLDQRERAAAEANGVRIEFLPLVEGISTTGIVERIEEARRREKQG